MHLKRVANPRGQRFFTISMTSMETPRSQSEIGSCFKVVSSNKLSQQFEAQFDFSIFVSFSFLFFFLGTNYNGAWDSWYGPSGRDDTYNYGAVVGSLAGRAVSSIGHKVYPEKARALREAVSVTCAPKNSSLLPCKLLEAPCLFRVYEDPCETNNLAHV